jgi:hypothetical protein
MGFVFLLGAVAGIGVWFSLWWLALGIPMWALFWLGIAAGVAVELKNDKAKQDA